MGIEPEQAQPPVPRDATVAAVPGQPEAQAGRDSTGTILQTATAAESAVVIQVGGDLYLSDAGLSDLWAPRQATTPGECPYPGLDAFGPSSAKWFYGRESATGDLLRYLDQMARGGPGGPLLVVAPSGTGKSSLLGAGLLNALAEGRLPSPGSASWPRLMITPGSHPLRTLRSALTTLANVQTVGGDPRFVVVIDQLEEVFTLCESEAERSGFFDEIGTLAADAGPGSALVVLGMRADFYARATAYPVLRQAMQSRQVVLGAMSAAEVRQAVIRPARAVGLRLEAGLADRLLRDLGVDEGASAGEYGAGESPGADSDRDGSRSAGDGYEPGRLPLLAHALRATWQHRDGSRLTIAGYVATGGIAGAIARTAEDVYARLDEPGQTATRQIFLGLVRVGEATGDSNATADTRRRVSADSLLAGVSDPAAARAALDAFTAARLLTSGGQAVEITHEALLRRWPRLRGWIDEDRSGLLVRQELEDAAATWAREGRDPAGLYGGVRLASAQGWAADPLHLRELTQAGRDFLAASERRRRRGTRRRNGIIAVLAALSLLLAGLSVFALNQRSTAQAQRSAAQAEDQKAEGELLAAEGGQAWADFRPDTGLKFAVEADRLDPSAPQVRSTLLNSQAVPITGRLLVNGAPQKWNIEAAVFNPADTLIAGTTQDGKVQLWSAATYRLLWSFQFPSIKGAGELPVNGVAFSPDGRTMVVAHTGGPWLFDVSNPAHPVHVGTLRVPAIAGIPDVQVISLALSRDGTMVAAGITSGSTVTDVGSVLLWNVSTRALAGVIPEETATGSLAFTPDGRSLVTGTDKGIDLWDTGTRTKTAVVRAGNSSGASGVGTGVAVSPDGQTIAFGVQTGTVAYAVKLWSLASRQVTATVNANGADGITSVAFSPDGKQLAAADLAGTVRLWDVASVSGPPLLLGNLSGHRAPILHIAFSHDGATLASAGEDGTIVLWDTRGVFVDGLANASDALAFSPNGKTLAVSTIVSRHYVIALYGMPAKKLAGVLPVNGVAALAFSPDGKTLAVASANMPGDPVELWNVATRQMTGQFTTGFTSRINSIAFSPDGTLLAASGFKDTTMQVWSTAQLTRVASFSVTQHSQYAAQVGGGVFQLAFSPDGRLLAVAGTDGMIRTFSVPGFALLNYFQELDSTTSLAFSPDGRTLAFGNSDGNVYLDSVPATYTNPSSPLPFRGVFAASSKPIYSVEFLSNDSLIAGGGDSVVRFWNVPPGDFNAATTPAQTLGTHGGAISALSYSAPLGLLATGSPYGSRVWEASPAQVAANICQTLKAPVRKDLWKEYLPDIPYTPVCG
jgi:WD40 repeat protein